MSKHPMAIALSLLFAGIAAHADSSAFFANVLNAPQFDESSVSQKTKAQAEHERLRQLEAATNLEEAMDAYTPEELAAELGLQSENMSVPLAENDVMEVYARSGSSVVSIDVNIAPGVQRLTVSSPEGTQSLRISSARSGYHTVTGCYRPTSLQTMHYSKKYHNSPMPHSIFFRGGFAIHGTLAEGQLGRPASHGCVRVSRSSASYLYSLVSTYGAHNTIICIHY